MGNFMANILPPTVSGLIAHFERSEKCETEHFDCYWYEVGWTCVCQKEEIVMSFKRQQIEVT